MILHANGEQIECSKVVKGTDYIHVYDSNNNCFYSFSGISSFDGYSLDGGSFSEPEIDDITALQLAVAELAGLI